MKVYIIQFSGGCYSDAWQSIGPVFLSREIAEEYKAKYEKYNEQIKAFNQKLCSLITNFMNEKRKQYGLVFPKIENYKDNKTFNAAYKEYLNKERAIRSTLNQDVNNEKSRLYNLMLETEIAKEDHCFVKTFMLDENSGFSSFDSIEIIESNVIESLAPQGAGVKHQ